MASGHGRLGSRKRRRCHRVAVAAATRWRLEILDPFVEEVTHPAVHLFAVAISKDAVVVIVMAAALIDILRDVLVGWLYLLVGEPWVLFSEGQTRRPRALRDGWNDLGGDDSLEAAKECVAWVAGCSLPLRKDCRLGVVEDQLL